MINAVGFTLGAAIGALVVGVIHMRDWFRMRAVMRDARRTMRNAVSAVETNQIEDKDVRGQLWRGIRQLDEELK